MTFFVATQFSLNAQNNVITELWTEATGAGVYSGNFGAPTLVDASDNIYKAGYVKQAQGGTDAVLLKLDEEGALLWSRTLNTSSVNLYEPTKIVTDGSSIFISGVVTYLASGTTDFFLAEVNSSGALQWLNVDVTTGNDAVADMIYHSNSLYVCGTTERNGDYDLLVASYATDGTSQWLETRDYNGNIDGGAVINIDGSDLFINGASQSSTTQWDIVSWQYSDAGVFGSEQRNSGMSAGNDELKDGVLNNGFVNLTGSTLSGSQTDFKVVCLDANNNYLWSDTYDKGGLNDEGSALVAVASGFVATGYATAGAGDENILIRKYDTTGTLAWSKEIDYAGGNDRGIDIIEDDSGNYLLVADVSSGSQKDVHLYSINKSNGDVIWDESVSQDAGLDEEALSIEATMGGQVYVTYEVNNLTVTESYSYSDLDFPQDNEDFSRGSFYIENSGQLKNQDLESVMDVRYYSFGMNPEIFYSDDMISSVVADTGSAQRINFEFVNNHSTHVGHLEEFERETHFNYYYDYLKYEQQGTFDVLAYPDVYERTDVFISSNSEGFKMTMVLKSGADLSDFEMDIQGASGVSISGGDLQVQTISKDITWLDPISYTQSDPEFNDDNCIDYTLVNGKLKLTTTCGELDYPYVIAIRGGVGVAYAVSQIDNMDWSTFWGGAGDDGCYDVEADDQGNLYIAGFAHNSTLAEYPGAYIPNYVLRVGNGLVAKFDHHGTNVWNSFVSASQGTLPINHTASVAIKGVGKFNSSIASFPTEKVHFVGEYFGMLSPFYNSFHIPPNAYKQTNATIPRNSKELFFGTLDDGNGVMLMITPFGGSDIDAVYGMDINDDGLMYFVGSTKSTGDVSTSSVGYRTPPSGHSFPVFDPQDQSVFIPTHPDPYKSKRGFVSVIDLNPNSANHYQLAYSSIITKNPTTSNDEYEIIYDIECYGNGVSFCGRGLIVGRIGFFSNENVTPSIFTKDLNNPHTNWAGKREFYSASVPRNANGTRGGFFMGIDLGTTDPLRTKNLTHNQYQATTGKAYIVHVEDTQILWDTWFGQSGNIAGPSNGTAYTNLYSVPFYQDDISGRGSLVTHTPEIYTGGVEKSTLFAAGSVAGSPVETKSKSGYFDESTIDQNSKLADVFIAAFTDNFWNTNAFNWGTLYGGEGDNSSSTITGEDYLSDIQSYTVAGQDYLVTVSSSFSRNGSKTADVEKYPVADLGATKSYFSLDNHNTSAHSLDIAITRFKITDIRDVVSLEEVKMESPVKLYPNPGTRNVEITLKEEDIKKVIVIDLKGRVLIEKEYPKNTEQIVLNISKLSIGVYIINVNGQYAEQFIKY